MKLRRISAALLAALTAVSIFANTAFAEQATNEQPEPAETSVTTEEPVTQATEEQPTETSANEWQPTETTTTTAAPVTPTEPVTESTTTTYEAPEPTATPATVSLKISEVKDKKFTVDIMVDCPKKIANAQFSIEYDELMLQYDGCTHNDEAGGMAVENSFDGKFVYNYVNPEGTNYTGSYCTVNFSVIDDKLTSTVLYLTVNDLSDEKAVTISCQTENGILKYKAADPADETYRDVKLKLADSPYTADDLIAAGEIMKIDIEDGSVLVYENEQFKALKAGSTKVTIEYADSSVARLNVIIEDEESSSVAETTETTTTAAVSTADKNDSSKNSALMFILIGIVVLLGAALVFGEYYFLVKKRSTRKPDDDEFDEDDYYDE